MKRLFISYSHCDEDFRNYVERHLVLLKRSGVLNIWHDRCLVPGSDINHSISQNLEEADIVLLLVSSDFLASDYCYEVELVRAMERHNAGLATVVPVIVRPCDWHDSPFGKLNALPKDGKPISLWQNHDEAMLEVAKGVRVALSSSR